MTGQPPVRIGVLGASYVVPRVLIRPAREIPGVSVAAIAARDPQRAEAFARKHDVPRVHASYDDLIADSDLDAVYIPLPTSHHLQWVTRALRAGKNVLCEKPLAANAAEAESMFRVAKETGGRLVEAMHCRFHPIAKRMQEIVTSGELGKIQHVETQLCVPLFSRKANRFQYEMAGGALLDIGCYTTTIMRLLAGEEPAEVTLAEARLASAQVDQALTAEFEFPSGTTGRIVCSMFSLNIFRSSATVKGDAGEMRVFNPYTPQMPYRFRVRDNGRWRSEKVSRESTYSFQLKAFAEHLRNGAALPFDAADVIANQRVMDAIYDKMGLQRRGTEA